MRIGIVAVVFVLAGIVSAADRPQAAPKRSTAPAWKWTTEERLALRLDPAAIRDRSAAAGDPATGSSGVQVQSQATRFVIDGARDPQLFLPWELFNSLVGSLREDSLRERQRHARDIEAFGWKEAEFWSRLTGLTDEYRARNARLIERMQAMEAMPPAERRTAEAWLEEENIALCGLRADALARARAHFGAESFERFLYTAVAPHIQISSGGTADDRERRRLLFVEAGCR